MCLSDPNAFCPQDKCTGVLERISKVLYTYPQTNHQKYFLLDILLLGISVDLLQSIHGRCSSSTIVSASAKTSRAAVLAKANLLLTEK